MCVYKEMGGHVFEFFMRVMLEMIMSARISWAALFRSIGARDSGNAASSPPFIAYGFTGFISDCPLEF